VKWCVCAGVFAAKKPEQWCAIESRVTCSGWWKS
jgi:hypothetical protein